MLGNTHARDGRIVTSGPVTLANEERGKEGREGSRRVAEGLTAAACASAHAANAAGVSHSFAGHTLMRMAPAHVTHISETRVGKATRHTRTSCEWWRHG